MRNRQLYAILKPRNVSYVLKLHRAKGGEGGWMVVLLVTWQST